MSATREGLHQDVRDNARGGPLDLGCWEGFPEEVASELRSEEWGSPPSTW